MIGQVVRLLRSRGFKFLLGGGVAAFLNLLLIFLMIEQWGFTTPLLRNLANLLSIELSLIASFFIYRTWVWTGGTWNLREVLLRQLPLYHVSAGAAIVVRVLLFFPLLDWLGINYGVNTLLGALLSAVINYILSDRFVFRDAPKGDASSLENSASSQYYPEPLTPAIAQSPNRTDTASLIGRDDDNDSSSHLSSSLSCLSIVIPAYNEEDCLEPTLHSLTSVLEQSEIDYEIVVVNDNSKDRTKLILQQFSAKNPRVRCIDSYYPNGFGFAVRCGLENFRGDAVAIVMADSSDDPHDIVAYYRYLQEGYDCVFGSRFIPGGRVVDYPSHKLLVNRMANFFVKSIFGLRFNDTTNAFKMYRKEVIQGISPLISHHFNLTVEIPLKAVVRGYSYKVVPITWRNRAAGVSKLKLKEMGSRYLFIVLYIWLEKYLSRGDYHRNNLKVTPSTQPLKEKTHV